MGRACRSSAGAPARGRSCSPPTSSSPATRSGPGSGRGRDVLRFLTVLVLVQTIAPYMRGVPRLRGGAHPRPPAGGDGPPVDPPLPPPGDRSWRHDPELARAAAGRRRRGLAGGHRAAAGGRVRARAGAGGRGDPREPRPARAVARGRRRGRDRVHPPVAGRPAGRRPRRAPARTGRRAALAARARWTSRSRCSSARSSTSKAARALR